MRIGDADASDGVPVVRVVESDAANLPNQTRARLRRDARGGGRGGRRGSGERSRSLVRAPELERGSGGVRGAWAGDARGVGGGEGGAGVRGRARRRGGGHSLRAGGAAAREANPAAVLGSNRATSPPARGPRRGSGPGAPRRRRHRRRRARAVAPRRAGEGARRGTRARRARRRAASAPRIAPEGRRDADALGRESRGDAGGGRLVRRRRTAEHVKETLDQNQLARRAIACDARPRGAAAKGSRAERGAAVNGDRTRTEDSETLATLTRAQVGRRASRIGRRRGGRGHSIPTWRRFFRVTRTQINLHFLKTTTGSAMIVSAPVGGRPSQC